MSMNSFNQIPSGPVFAKTIILGDHQTGKTSLLYNLDFNNDIERSKIPENQHHFAINISHDNNFFSTIEFTSEELESTNNQNALLKIWEYSEHLNPKDEHMAFRGAFFCIIVFNICSIDSYQAVFDRWLPMREKYCPDSYVYIVGTHLDRSHERMIDIQTICKACARKDAMYIEVSNLHHQNMNVPQHHMTYEMNILLLRKLLCKRIQFIIQKKDQFANHPNSYADTSNYTKDLITSLMSDESKQRLSDPNQEEISVPFLEPNIFSHNIGAILSSTMGLTEWKGFQQQENELSKIAESIDAFVTNLALDSDDMHTKLDLATLPINEEFLEELNKATSSSTNSQASSSIYDNVDYSQKDLENSLQELQEAFDILGLKLPKELAEQLQPPSDLNTSTASLQFNSSNFSLPNTLANGNLSLTNPPPPPPSMMTPSKIISTRKMMIKLPTGNSTELILDLDNPIEQQLDFFFQIHNMNSDHEAKRKLLQISMKMQRDYYESLNNRSRTLSKSSGTLTPPMYTR